MLDEKNKISLTDHYLSAQETHRIASNLNRIEAERERQQDPTRGFFIRGLLSGIAFIPIIVFFTYGLLECSSTTFDFIFYLAGGTIALTFDLRFIVAVWKVLVQK